MHMSIAIIEGNMGDMERQYNLLHNMLCLWLYTLCTNVLSLILLCSNSKTERQIFASKQAKFANSNERTNELSVITNT